MVKIISQKKKSDCFFKFASYVKKVCKCSRFEVIDDFKEFVPSTPDFQVGYMQGASKQCWIVRREDLDLMYETVGSNREIVLWCDKKVIELQNLGSRKRKSNEDGAPTPKASRAEETEFQIMDKLKDKHSNTSV